MSESLDRFINMLLRSGLITEAQLSDLHRQFKDEASQGHEDLIASKLAESGHLSDFQAKELREGKVDNLIVGDYIILQPVAKGGMGEVYRARHCVMKREVAVKFTLPNEDGKVTEAFVRRFQREVETASKLLHPNIVNSLDAGHRGEVCYLVMEFVRGENLAKHVRKHGPMPFARALDCIIQVAQGLEYAHRKGVVHRDIKPSNLILAEDGQVKILDMGLVRTNAPSDLSQPTAEAEEHLTKTGHLLGTVDFMAPEQAMDPRTADARSDIYSLGCTLYYLLFASAPYRRYAQATTMSCVIAHREKPIPSITGARADVPEDFQRVFEKMLNKDPEHRYQSVSELLQSLRKVQADLDNFQVSVLTETRTYTKASSTKSTRRGWIGLGLAATCLAAAAVVWQWLAWPKADQTQVIEPQKEEQGASSPISEKVDLLAKIDLKNDWLVGKGWEITNGTLTIPNSSPSKLHVPVVLPESFQLSMRVTRTASDGPFAFGMNEPVRKFHFLVDARRKSGSVHMTALGSTEGRLAVVEDNKLLLEPNVESELILTVTANSLVLQSGGQRIVQWEGDWKDLSLPSGWQVSNRPGLFVGSNDGASFTMSQLEVMPLPQTENTHATQKMNRPK